MNKSEKKLIEEFDKIIKNIKNDIKEICEQGGVPALLWIDDVEYLESFILKALAQQKQELEEYKDFYKRSKKVRCKIAELNYKAGIKEERERVKFERIDVNFSELPSWQILARAINDIQEYLEGKQ